MTESTQTPAGPERPIVSLRDVRRDYALGAERVHALQGVTLEVERETTSRSWGRRDVVSRRC